ncbi:DUF1993 family protein [Microbulbifer sp. MLAF003]|uniref:DUF1993 family protein n=1 Tax=unclassified Microbulbifer TaxID=2619833 RepID=UPI0024AD1E78|nr:DUF1993 family protein [Microbulbifer sp. MLAF003]WHI52804.1 DUF1993 family protein [Microbulbifer sp. MLAF003]
MQPPIKSLLCHHLSQLLLITNKIPQSLFGKQLSPDMFSMGDNAKIAANFALRGYCPLVGRKVVSFDKKGVIKEDIQDTIQRTLEYLDTLPKVTQLDTSRIITDKAGFIEVQLPQIEFIYQYILPNLLFHISLVYGTARAHGVALSKGDFDGYHSYPAGFSFV